MKRCVRIDNNKHHFDAGTPRLACVVPLLPPEHILSARGQLAALPREGPPALRRARYRTERRVVIHGRHNCIQFCVGKLETGHFDSIALTELFIRSYPLPAFAHDHLGAPPALCPCLIHPHVHKVREWDRNSPANRRPRRPALGDPPAVADHRARYECRVHPPAAPELYNAQRRGNPNKHHLLQLAFLVPIQLGVPQFGDRHQISALNHDSPLHAHHPLCSNFVPYHLCGHEAHEAGWTTTATGNIVAQHTLIVLHADHCNNEETVWALRPNRVLLHTSERRNSQFRKIDATHFAELVRPSYQRWYDPHRHVTECLVFSTEDLAHPVRVFPGFNLNLCAANGCVAIQHKHYIDLCDAVTGIWLLRQPTLPPDHGRKDDIQLSTSS
ncbi:hypothetical protein Pelo_7159 [Pelomyxa schiedti]|nr:hypothetical protein Pelo_7159 [Pelomyxa schiedti]